MGSLARKLKRANGNVTSNRAMRKSYHLDREQQAARASIKHATQIDTLITVWCDGGKTKPKCYRCPVCLHGYDPEAAGTPSPAVSNEQN